MFIPYGRQTISEEDIEAVEKVLRSDFLTQGPCVPEFERAVAEKVGAKHAVAVNSATSALHLACLALNLGVGDRLWTTPITFVASANCGRYCGADIDFVDIETTTGLLCTKALAEKLAHAKRSETLPKIIVPVHLAGSSCNMREIGELAEEYDFAVIEDASHAIGGHYKGKPVGCCEFSKITVFSFHPVKIITTGEGGLATTNDAELAQRLMDLRSHGIIKEPSRFKKVADGPWTYEQQSLGFNYRLTDIQAALGLSQLQRLETIVSERHKLYQNYESLLEGLPAKMMRIPRDTDSSLHLGILRLNNTDPAHHLHIFRGMREAGIGVQLHYSPVHLQPYYRKLGFQEDNFPTSETYAHSAISLPLYPGLTENQQQLVVATLSRLINDSGGT